MKTGYHLYSASQIPIFVFFMIIEQKKIEQKRVFLK